MFRAILMIVFTLLTTSARAGETEKTLAQYQSEIDSTVNGALNRLSPTGKKDLADAQNQWLLFVKEFCAEKNLHWRYETKHECILAQYRSRASRLSNVTAINKDGSVILRREYFATKILDVTEDPDNGRNFWPAEIYDSWPEFDKPSDDMHRQWNEAMAKGHPGDEEIEGRPCDYSGSYTITIMTEELIGMTRHESHYCHSAAHGWGGVKSINWMLHEGRELKADDIFDEKAGWTEAVTKLSISSLKAQGKKFNEEDVKSSVTNMSLWVLKPESTQINFGQLSSYVEGHHIAEIPWSELKPYLKKSSFAAKLSGE